MAEKKVKTRIQQKHDIEANWDLATGFIPMAGEVIVYDVDETYNYERFKIGDGKTRVIDLPFAVNPHTHDSYINQNAFSKVKVGNKTVEADTATDTLELVAGANTAITPDEANDKITISSVDTNTTYGLSAPASKTNGNVTIDLAAGGSGSGIDSVKIMGSGATAVTTDDSGVVTISSTDTNTHNSHAVISGKKSDGTTDIKGSASDEDITLGDSGVTAGEYGPTENATPDYGETFNVPDIKVNSKGIVTSITNKTVKIPASDNSETTFTVSDKSYTDTNELVYAITDLVESGTSGHTLIPTYTGLPTKAYVDSLEHEHPYIPTSAKGANGGVAELDENGKVPSTQLPSYVDDVLEYTTSDFPTTGETGKIYVDTTTNKTYRWSGSQFTEISESLALGTTSSTAFRGDHGSAAYEHSQADHAPVDAEKNQNAFGSIKVGPTTFFADSPTDTLELAAGANVTITHDANSDKVTISSSYENTKVTSADNHYSPVAYADALLSADAINATSTASWNLTQLVTGVNIQRDRKGHVTGLTVDSVKMPMNPDTNTHYLHTIISGKNADGTADIKGSSSSNNLTLGDSGVTAGEYGPTSNQTPGYGATFNVPDIKVNSKGIVTAISNRTVKIPASDNTETTLTVTDKSNLLVNTDDLVYAITNLTEGGNAGHTISPTYTGLPTKTYVDNSTSNLQNQIDNKLPNFSINIDHQTAGNPRQVKFLTVNYASYTSNLSAYFKLSATSCHGNGSSYQFLEDIIIGVAYNSAATTPTGPVVTCNVYKHCQQSCGTNSYNLIDGVERNYGDVYYVIDLTNKKVDFYILCGQYASSQFTPITKIGSTTTTGITQHSGIADYYSSGTKVWANGIGSTYTALPPQTFSVNGAVSTFNGVLGNSILGSIVDLVHPIGSVIMTIDSNFNPGTSWPGTAWTQWTDGYLKVDGTPSTTVAGATDYKITSAMLPTHTHTVPAHGHTFTGTASTTGNVSSANSGITKVIVSGTTDTSGRHTHEVYNDIDGDYSGRSISTTTTKSESSSYRISTDSDDIMILQSGEHVHSVTSNEAKGHSHDIAHTHTYTPAGTISDSAATNSDGGGFANNVYKPRYYAVIAWQRTA